MGDEKRDAATTTDAERLREIAEFYGNVISPGKCATLCRVADRLDAQDAARASGWSGVEDDRVLVTALRLENRRLEARNATLERLAEAAGHWVVNLATCAAKKRYLDASENSHLPEWVRSRCPGDIAAIDAFFSALKATGTESPY